MTKRPCIVCGTPSNRTRCPEHTVDHGYDSGHWRSIRAQRLLMDGHRCQLQHEGCTVKATTVHLAPILGGRHELATLDTTTSACAHCHGVEDAPRATGHPPTSTTTGARTGAGSDSVSRTSPRAHVAGGGEAIEAVSMQLSDPAPATRTETGERFAAARMTW